MFLQQIERAIGVPDPGVDLGVALPVHLTPVRSDLLQELQGTFCISPAGMQIGNRKRRGSREGLQHPERLVESSQLDERVSQVESKTPRVWVPILDSKPSLRGGFLEPGRKEEHGDKAITRSSPRIAPDRGSQQGNGGIGIPQVGLNHGRVTQPLTCFRVLGR